MLNVQVSNVQERQDVKMSEADEMQDKKVLLVEDEPLVAMIAVDVLNDLGFDVVETASARAALEQLNAPGARFAFALVDLGLPDRPGEELVAEMRSMHPDIPVIIASGYGKADLRGHLKSSERIAFLGKPYQRAGLEASITSLGIPFTAT